MVDKGRWKSNEKKKSVINYLLMAILKVLVIRKLSSKKNVIFLEKALKKKIISFSKDFGHFHFLQKLWILLSDLLIAKFWKK